MPGRAGKSADTDGYDAVQLAFEPVAERKLTKPELGHLAKAGLGAYRRLVEFRGGMEGAVEGETVTVEIFAPGDKVKVADAAPHASQKRASSRFSAPQLAQVMRRRYYGVVSRATAGAARRPRRARRRGTARPSRERPKAIPRPPPQRSEPGRGSPPG